LQGVFLDSDSMGTDLDRNCLESTLSKLTSYGATQPEEVINKLAQTDIVIVNKVVLGAKEFAACPTLKLIAVTATGTNNIDLDAARAANIKVCNVTQYGRPTIVQHTFSLILALANQLLNYTQDVQNDAWQKSATFCLMNHPIQELEGKTMGIIGYGDLGKGVAKMAEAFGMKVILGARPDQNTCIIDGKQRLPLDKFLPQVDVLSLHCLLSESTLDLIDEHALSLMKPSAFLVNVARGGIVNEAALASALKSGKLAGAATDVLTTEPPIQGNVLLDPTIPNLIVTPHCAWASKEARQRLLNKTANNIQRFLDGSLDRFVV